MAWHSAPAAPSRPDGLAQPTVTLLLGACEDSACRELIGLLDAEFRCTTRQLHRDLPSEVLRRTDLVIWPCDCAHLQQLPQVTLAVHRAAPGCPVIVVAEDVVELTPEVLPGNVDFVVRPYGAQELLLRARRALAARAAPLEPPAAPVGKAASIVVGRSAALTRELDKLRRYARCDAGVLILGETGTGKEVFAQALHYVSQRAGGPMVAVNCGAVPPELMEAELFGHVKGAYTNAHAARTGLVGEAERGTLFLDDVDCLPLPAQAKLLRFLQEREYRVVGSNTVRHADVRVVAASNRDLAGMARQGTFRQDLYYRLHVLTLALPPLRERKEDIPLLADHFLRQFAQRHDRPASRLSANAARKLLAYDWPGNVRELGHVLERALLLAGSTLLQAEDVELPQAAGPDTAGEDFQALKARVVQSFEHSYIENLLASTNGNIAEAARRAGKNRRAFFELIRKHEITPADFRSPAQR